MAYTDLERRRDGLIGASPSASGSYRQNEVPYTFSAEADAEAKVSLPFQTEWFQISATTSDAVLNDYTIIAKLSDIPSGSNAYSIDERA